jgi:hypothetical protein
MNLRQEFEDQIRRYLDRDISARDLFLWLGSVVDEAFDSPDPEVDKLNILLWELLSEWTSNEREEDSVRAELIEALPPTRTAPAPLGEQSPIRMTMSSPAAPLRWPHRAAHQATSESRGSRSAAHLSSGARVGSLESVGSQGFGIRYTSTAAQTR